MEYGKAFGISSAGSTAILGFRLGYGWLVAGVVVMTISLLVAIKVFFHRKRLL